ncbi:hypothetical protein GCM10010191_72640 [Actinomadura vinacea]|uniref:DUF2207 domain-containing protein n=1 Tax=Actinomadura vinacea TaxID=115336 RepID=A0ABN3JZQ7_9ACTN
MTAGPSTARPKGVLRRALAIITALLAVSAILVIVLLDAALDDPRRFDRLEQPASVTYPDESKHYVGLVQRRSLIFGRVTGHDLYAGRFPDMSYGHFVRLDITGEERPDIKDASWDRNGVRVRFTTGHELFVPVRYFMYGR